MGTHDKPRVWIAASRADHERVQDVARDVVTSGCVVHSTWHTEALEAGEDGRVDARTAYDVALTNCAEIVESDLMLLVRPKGAPGRGVWFDFGHARANCTPVWLLGGARVIAGVRRVVDRQLIYEELCSELILSDTHLRTALEDFRAAFTHDKD